MTEWFSSCVCVCVEIYFVVITKDNKTRIDSTRWQGSTEQRLVHRRKNEEQECQMHLAYLARL